MEKNVFLVLAFILNVLPPPNVWLCRWFGLVCLLVSWFLGWLLACFFGWLVGWLVCSLVVIWLVSMITQKLLNRFPLNLDGGWISVQKTPH